MSALALQHHDPITEAQRALKPLPTLPQTADEFVKVARWWELEAARGYASSRASLRYATNMEWAAEARKDSAARPWTPGVDVAAPECSVCGGPVDGPWGCGGARDERISKLKTVAVCEARAAEKAGQRA